MNKKSVFRNLIGAILILCLMMLPNIVNAATMSPSLYFGITELRESGMGYSIGDPGVNGTTGPAAKIWNIVQYSGPNTDDPTETNVYCIKAGVGFVSGEGIKGTQEYNVKFDMYTERQAIAAQNSVLNGLVNGGHYNELLALANLIYIPGESTEEEKTQLIENAGIYQEQYPSEEYYLTDDEIESVQQAAMWYFTNYGEESGKYDKYNNTSWLWYTTDGSEYENLTGYNPTGVEPNLSAGKARQEQAELLYKYLIDTAKANASQYADSNAKHRNKLTLYASTENGMAQPLMDVERIPQEFDLALRKYITKVNGENVVNSRVPSIDETTLENGTTATYKHRKDPIMVEKGDVVTYNITIYNEGDLDGRATKVIDQLPTGLKYSKINTQGFTGTYDEATNRLTITREENNTENLTAYEKGKLDSETIEIECIVDTSENEKILTNVAWIAEEVDEYGNIITNQVGEDRDSEPATAPNVDKDNMENYKGNTQNKDDLADSEYFYEGEQDDDDFEKLIVEKNEFDLKLIKRITEVNGEKVPERLLGVDITNLANGSQTTADYQMNKEPVVVKTGDLVTYTFRIYNEGSIDGYAEEITEDIPEGLEFLGADVDANMNPITDEDELAAVKFNTSMGWTYVQGDSTKIATDYLGKGKGEEITTPGANLIKAFDPESPYSDTETNRNPDYREVSVIFKVVAEDASIGIVRNEAAITEDADSNGDPVDDRDSSTDDWVKYEDDEDYDNVVLQQFDLALRKFISEVDGTTYNREPSVDLSGLENGTTAIYNHPKDPVLVKRNSVVIYTIRVYNESEIDGYAEEITDYLPAELEYLPDHEINIQYEWKISEDGRIVTTDYLSSAKETEERQNEIKAYDGERLDYKEVKIACRVREEAESNVNLTNLAEITEDSDNDRDSTPDNVEVPSDEELPGYKDEEIDQEYVPGQEDDDDFEKVYVEDFDLALRKFISEVDGTTYNREPSVDLSGLENGTTAIYNHPKDPVLVKRNSVVIYTIRVYNESEIDGYAEEITDYLPAELEYLPDHEINIQYEWKISEDGRIVTTDYLSSAKETEERQNELKAYDGERLDYKEVKIACRVREEAESKVNLTNLAEITEDSDKDRDSTPDNVEVPNDEELPGYKDEEIDKDYVPGQEDDDDFEKVYVQDFDLALRKFITKVDEEEVDTRIPEVSYDREEEKITYNHTKDPVEVVTGNVVEYTIRVYNEGDIAGYAEEVADDIPDGLKFLPENDTNKEYRWVMYDEEGNETENVEEAVEIRTDYLSKEQEETEGENLLKAFNPEEPIGEGNPDYRDIKVAFEVVEPNGSDKIIVNSAQITEDSDENGDPVEDKDSIPDEWNEGEDDQDKEYIKLTYFDLALRKWVTEAIVIENGQETVTQTGHTAEMDPEPVVKVELYRKDINDVVVKFRYKIRVTNEGDIAGYAKEITDYVPEGLRFIAEDNPGWTDEGNNIISTRLLENTLLQPGESAEVEVVLTWINGEDNMGQMTNIAEISEDYNDKGVPDRDSTPDNQVPGEDDIDDAPVLLSIETGQQRIYFVLGLTVLGTLAGGLVLIKKFVI